MPAFSLNWFSPKILKHIFNYPCPIWKFHSTVNFIYFQNTKCPWAQSTTFNFSSKILQTSNKIQTRPIRLNRVTYKSLSKFSTCSTASCPTSWGWSEATMRPTAKAERRLRLCPRKKKGWSRVRKPTLAVSFKRFANGGFGAVQPFYQSWHWHF